MRSFLMVLMVAAILCIWYCIMVGYYQRTGTVVMETVTDIVDIQKEALQ